MAAVALIADKARTHEVTVSEVETRQHRGQGHALCTCGWQDVNTLLTLTITRARQHIKAAHHAANTEQLR